MQATEDEKGDELQNFSYCEAIGNDNTCTLMSNSSIAVSVPDVLNSFPAVGSSGKYLQRHKISHSLSVLCGSSDY